MSQDLKKALDLISSIESDSCKLLKNVSTHVHHIDAGNLFESVLTALDNLQRVSDRLRGIYDGLTWFTFEEHFGCPMDFQDFVAKLKVIDENSVSSSTPQEDPFAERVRNFLQELVKKIRPVSNDQSLEDRMLDVFDDYADDLLCGSWEYVIGFFDGAVDAWLSRSST